MVDQINEAFDIIIPLMDHNRQDENDDEQQEKIIYIPAYKTNQRPLYFIKRKKYFEMVRKEFQTKNRILLRTLNTYAFYSCNINEMQEKIIEHMTNTSAYLFIVELNKTNQHYIDIYLNMMNEQITLTLNKLVYNKLITLERRTKMKVHRDQCQLNSLYFLPDTRQENVPFHPMINCHRGLTTKISCYLSELILPIYNRVTYLKTFRTSIDVIDAIKEYTNKGFLQSNTQFVTLHIHHLSTIISHQQMIELLQHFLQKCIIDGRIQGISIQVIVDLVRLFLENQYLLYDNKLYQQIRGCPVNSPLATILVNISIYYWQQELINILDQQNEIFGRCFDEIFFTWNDSDSKLYGILNIIKKQYPDIEITMKINQNINYLDANISHINGDLKIQVAHDLDTEPYTLPYIHGHQFNNYGTLARAAFIRATRCYTNVYEFANEFDDIQSAFLNNMMNPDVFLDEYRLFLEEFDAIDLKIHWGEEYYNQSLYEYLRQNVTNYHQSQIQNRIKKYYRQTTQYRWKSTIKSSTQFTNNN